MDNRVEALISAIERLRGFSHTKEDTIEVKNALDRVFLPDAKCNNFVYTVNTDKLPFGCVIFPVIEESQINDFLINGGDIRFDKYDIEIDSKLFDYGLTNEEIAQIMLFNIYHLVKDFTPGRVVRDAIDTFFTNRCTNLSIYDSVQYKAIISFGLVDALNKVVNCLNLPNDVLSDPFLESLGLDNFRNALDRLYALIPGCNTESERLSRLSVLEWCLRLYTDVKNERIPALHMLDKCKYLTASLLYTNRLNACIVALNKIDTELYINESVDQIVNEIARKNHGLLHNLRYNGLRDIESDLYEFQVRAKNAETENDVMYALKQINARLAILDDYIRQNPNDPDIDRWIGVKIQYMEIRDLLAKKKLNKHQYSVFVDYDAIDRIDKDSDNEY